VEVSKIRVSVRLHIEQDGDAYHGFAPSLRGCHVSGSTMEETKKNLNDAITLYLTALMKRGLPLPIGCEPEVIKNCPSLGGTLTFAGIDDEQAVLTNEELDISIPVPA